MLSEEDYNKFLSSCKASMIMRIIGAIILIIIPPLVVFLLGISMILNMLALLVGVILALIWLKVCVNIPPAKYSEQVYTILDEYDADDTAAKRELDKLSRGV